MFVNSRLAILAMVFASVLLGCLLGGLGLPTPVAAPGAVFGVGLGAAILGLREGEAWTVVTVAGIFFIGLGVLFIVFDATHGHDFVMASVVTAVIGVVELSGVLGLPAGYRLVMRAVRRWERRRLATRMGLQYQRSDPSVVAGIGTMETRVTGAVPGRGRRRRSGSPFTWTHGPFQAAGPGHDVVSGTMHDMPFTVFDFDVAGGRSARRRVVRTAWLVELPVHLPYLGLPFAYCWDGWDEQARDFAGFASHGQLFGGEKVRQLFAVPAPSSFTQSPEFARELLTPEIRRLTMQELPSWWIDGQFLISVDGEPHGASSAVVMHRLEHMVILARRFPQSALSRWAQPPLPAGSRSAAWVRATAAGARRGSPPGRS
jgi:hypothetical protein